VDPNWHREVGDLKCETCNAVTRHAIISAAERADTHAEVLHQVATGWGNRVVDADGNGPSRRRIEEAWRQGLPRNPYLNHLWWISDEKKAREAGRTHLLAVCMEPIPVPEPSAPGRTTSTFGHDEIVKPREFHDVDREDPETGLWWYDLRCPDCLLRSNAMALQAMRKQLVDRLLQLTISANDLDQGAVVKLQAVLDDLESTSKGAADAP
jgi:hypothetical protein